MSCSQEGRKARLTIGTVGLGVTLAVQAHCQNYRNGVAQCSCASKCTTPAGRLARTSAMLSYWLQTLIATREISVAQSVAGTIPMAQCRPIGTSGRNRQWNLARVRKNMV